MNAAEQPQRLDVLPITSELAIPLDEIQFRFSRSGGPGGQHVNRTATRVEATLDVSGSPSFTPVQRERLLERLASHLDGEGVLRVVVQSQRSQYRNRQEALERLQDLLRQALRIPKKRRRSQVPRWARERRRAGKRQRSEVKRLRGRVHLGDE